jgi:hypothetical protein
MPNINGISSRGSLRINPRETQPRTSSNATFQEQFRSGFKNGIDVGNSALRQVAKPIAGMPALSAAINDVARNLTKTPGLENASISSNSLLDGDITSLEDTMRINNEDLLLKQMRVAEITTSYSTRSNILKAFFDALKVIGTNIRP